MIVSANTGPVGFKASETLLGIETKDLKGTTENIFRSFKASETLLGIETYYFTYPSNACLRLQSLWNPFRDWNIFGLFLWQEWSDRFKASETLLGIETKIILILFASTFCFKASETLLGIETDFLGL